MITVNQIYEAMQAIAPLELAEHWDNPGLLVDLSLIHISAAFRQRAFCYRFK